MMFGFPLALLFLPFGIGLLVYAYRQRVKAKKVLVGTTFLLAQFARKASKPSKIKIPPRFWLELLALFLLVGILSQLSLPRVNKKVAIIIDNSLSTGARISGSLSVSDVLQQEAKDKIIELGATSTFTLFTLGDSLQLADGEAQGVLPEISKIEVVRNEENIQLYLSAFPRGDYDTIYVFTDRIVSREDNTGPIKIVSLPKKDQELPNLAIQRASIDNNKVKLALKNFAKKRYQGEITLTSLGSEGRKLLKTDNFSIEPKLTKQLDIEFNPDELKELEVNIKTDTLDALTEDNTANLKVEGGSNVIGVLGDVSLEHLQLNALSEFSVKKISNETDLKQFAMVIAYKTPLSELKANALFVLPLDIKGVGSDIQVLSWNERHPVTRYINFLNFKVPAAAILNQIPWQERIIQSTEGPLLMAGEKNGFRTVVSGIELFPFEGSKAKTISILTVNTLKWLSSNNQNAAQRYQYFEHESDLENRETKFTQLDSSVTPDKKEIQSPLAGILLWSIFGFILFDLLFYFTRGKLMGAGAR